MYGPIATSAPCPNRGRGRASCAERSRAPAAPRPSRTPRARRATRTSVSSASSRTRNGAQLSRSVGRRLVGRRRAADRGRDVRVEQRQAVVGATRHRPVGQARARGARGHRKSPDASPVKTRPVRLPPCAAGASPTSRIRASGSPKPGTGRPQYVSSRKRATFSRATRSRHSTSRGQRRHATISRRQARRGPPGRSSARRPAYLSSSLSSRRDVIASPITPMIVRYATWTSRIGEIAPTVSDRIRSTPW